MRRSGPAYQPGVPLHVQIERVLRGRVESGEWEPNRAIPTEMDLMRQFRVSRSTIRAALDALARDGLIARHRGRGSFVQPAALRPPMPSTITNLVLGYQVQIKVVTVETVRAPGPIVEPLGVEPGTPVMRFVRLELADGAPLAVAINYMREELGRRIDVSELDETSMLELLRDRLRLRLGPIRTSIAACLPDAEIAALLGIHLTQPTLFVRLVVPDHAGRPLEVCDTFYRGDRYRYEVEKRLPRRLPTKVRRQAARR
jgi:GntR family transcriptional regulator